MNEKTTRQIKEMMNQTIGVEVEMNSITRAKAAQIAADFFGTRRHENTADRNGYCTYSAWDSEGREWKFQKDVSIHGPDSEKCEMVTPILTYADMETLQELICFGYVLGDALSKLVVVVSDVVMSIKRRKQTKTDK